MHRQIAQSLVIAEATVIRHVSNILGTGQGRTPPLAARVVESTPCLRACRTRLFAFGGLWPEQVTG